MTALKLGDRSKYDVRKLIGDDKTIEFTYNPLVQLTEIKDWLGRTKIEVDALGRVTKGTHPNKEVIEYSYGKISERKQIIYPDGRQVNYQYDIT